MKPLFLLPVASSSNRPHALICHRSLGTDLVPSGLSPGMSQSKEFVIKCVLVVRSVVVSFKILLEKCLEVCFDDKLMYARSSHMFYMGMISYSESYHDRTLPSLSLLVTPLSCCLFGKVAVTLVLALQISSFNSQWIRDNSCCS